MTKNIVLGGGCFWCLEAAYQRVKGIISVTSGYAGGDVVRPTYEMVQSGRTSHAEAVQLEYDEEVIELETILNIFWTIHDPTTPDQQGDDIGTQYRSIILYTNREEEEVVLRSIEEARELWHAPIVTETDYLTEFYPAEEYHQDYYRKHPTAGYCQAVIDPKLAKLRRSFASLLRDS